MSKFKAKKPVVQPARFQAVVYANRGVGKTHFCCSFPHAYYIDTEGLSKYPHFVKMLLNNDSELIYLSELQDIRDALKYLLATKHDYKTVVIDSITFPYQLMGNMEAERIAKPGKTEGTEFGINMAKAKRLAFEIGMLLTRLDLNVIVSAHEKVKYEGGIEVGKVSDVSDKLEYAVGTVIHLRQMGKGVSAFVEKSRYPELRRRELIDFDNGYEAISELLGKEVFEREVINEVLASKDQIAEFKRLESLLAIPEEKTNKWIQSFRAVSIDQLSSENIDKCIDAMKNQINKKQTQNQSTDNNDE